MQLNLDLTTVDRERYKEKKPFLKWAGGKRQLLPELTKYVPANYNRYIEPFLGAGALFFYLQPHEAILSDLNDELINCFNVVRDNVYALIELLQGYKNEEYFYYNIRELEPLNLTLEERAARFIYLNKTSFNGLYRVNKKGRFNVPFGRRKNPQICDARTLIEASEALQTAKICSGDYKSILRTYASPGDFVFLDPPYHPVGGYSDFNRFTKEFFYEEDHIELRDEFIRLVEKGCFVILTNSNTELIRKLYDGYDYKVINTRRMISSNPSTRTGEDLIVIGSRNQNKRTFNLSSKRVFLDNFPGTRFMGSKFSILPFIMKCAESLKFDSILDAFSGSACVSYMFKQMGKTVIANDFLHFAYHITNALVENSTVRLQEDELNLLMQHNNSKGSFVQSTFKNLYFSDKENDFLDNFIANLQLLNDEYKKSLALAAMSRACMKKRPRGIFTYVGDRYNDGRNDLKKTLEEHFIENVEKFNSAVFDNGRRNRALNKNVFDIDIAVDLVYLDPPYFTNNSDNDYCRRYHFIEGLVRNWKGLEIQYNTKTKKFKRYETPFLNKHSILEAFEKLFEKFKDSTIMLSYSSNSYPNKSELTSMLKNVKRSVEVFSKDHIYSFGTHNHKIGNDSNRVKEYIFIAD